MIDLRLAEKTNKFFPDWPNEWPFENLGNGFYLIQRGWDYFHVHASLEGIKEYIMLADPPVKMVANGEGFVLKVPGDEEIISCWIGKKHWHILLIARLAGQKLDIKEWFTYETSEEKLTWEALNRLRDEYQRNLERANRVRRIIEYIETNRKNLTKLSFKFPVNEPRSLARPCAEGFDNERKKLLNYYPAFMSSATSDDFYISPSEVGENETYWCELYGSISDYTAETLKQQVIVCFKAIDWQAILNEKEKELAKDKEIIDYAEEKLRSMLLP